MPLFSWFKKNGSRSKSPAPEENKDDKMQLTLKVMQSQQTDGPAFDISGCNAHYVPGQTYTYCKLLKKTKLLLHDNALTSMEEGGDINDLLTIEVLDIHNNYFSALPQSIGCLKNLSFIDASNNSLKSLPNSFSNLKKLQEINLDNNCLTKVPSCLCALPKLRKITMLGNKVKELPRELHGIQSSLAVLALDPVNLRNPFKDLYEDGGVEAVMRHICSRAHVEYTGVAEDSGGPVDELDASPKHRQITEDDSALTSVLDNYMRKKREMREKQLAFEKEIEDRDAEELDKALKKNSEDKRQLFSEIVDSGSDVAEYESKRQNQQALQSQLEQHMRDLQQVELEAYLNNSSGKEKMLENMTALQSQLDEEIEGAMELKDSERKHLLVDLYEGEKNTLAVMQEIISASAQKNAVFVALMEEQDNQLQELVTTAAGSAAEVRQAEVLDAMQKMLAEAVLLEERSKTTGLKHGWISSLIEDSEHSELHIKDVLSARQANQSQWTEMLLHDQECQAAAFKLLLLNNDLKRSNIMRQINQVEQELVRLSSLELRKKLMSMHYGSTTMLDQRKTLVGLLKSLLSQKSEREQQLETWLDQMEDIQKGGKEAADYWLVQYQRLLDVKPAGLAEAEDQLESDVIAVLEAARTLDVIPIFARYEITFDKLLEMTKENFAEIGIGLATYNTIQRALQHLLASKKLGDSAVEERSPSAPPEEYDECQSAEKEAPEEEQARAPSAPSLLEEYEDRSPSAPNMGALYMESECVVCLEKASAIILIPCGHVCVCYNCSLPLTECPMCRTGIYDKIVLGDEALSD